jgi:prepilin-type N-terminal cleavage/methylation domain-containing protein
MKKQRGFTLIELMVSLTISSLLAIMLLSIFTRMSFAFREHQQIVAVQQVLSAARNSIEADAQHAGFAMAQGFTLASDGGANRHSPVVITNASDGPDSVAFFYADGGTQALVTGGNATQITVDTATGFAANDLVVLSTADTVSVANPLSDSDANLAMFTACVVQISSVATGQVTFATSGTWGMAGNAHCATPSAGVTMMYKLVAHAWRVDPSRTELGVLQVDRTGALTSAPAWEDQAYGVTDLQTATYFFDGDGTDTDDPDTDPLRDWQSSGAQADMTAPRLYGSQFAPPLMMTMSLVARTTAKVEGVSTRNAPQLVDPQHVDHNLLGDRASFALTDRHVYRYLTFQVDLRNMGIGR